MALSLPGERSVSAGSSLSPIRLLSSWLVQTRKAAARRKTLQTLMELDDARLNDLGIDRGDIAEALLSRNGRTPGMVLNSARARNARS